MPRWAVIVLALILYAAVMAVVAVVANATVPGSVDWAIDRIGIGWAWVVLLAIVIPAGVYGYWPRRPDGTMRRLRSPWD